MASGGTGTAGAIAADQGSRLRLIIVLGALSAFGPLSIDMYLPGLPALQQEFGTSTSLVQLTLSACLLGLAAGQVLAGPASDALGRRKPLLVGLAAFAAVSLLCALAPSVPVLIGLRFLQGMAGAAGIVISRAVVRDLHAGVAAARFFSLLMLVNGTAPILAPIIGGQVLRFTSWRGVFLVLFVVGVALFLAGLFGVPETLSPEHRTEGSLGATLATFRMLLGDLGFLGYALPSGLAIAAMFAYISGSPFVLQDIFGLTPQQFSLAFGANALGIVAIGQLNGSLVGQVPLRRLTRVGLVASCAGAVVLLVVIGGGRLWLPGVLVGFFLVVASLGFVLPNTTALALTAYPRAAGSASALIGLLKYGIGAAAAPLVGIRGEGTALPMAVVIASLSFAALAVFLALGRWGIELE